jgi:hypothetical protein
MYKIIALTMHMENDMYRKSPFSIHVVSGITNFHIYAHGNRNLIEHGMTKTVNFTKSIIRKKIKNNALQPRHSSPSQHSLKGYDYSQAGLYFVTICVQNKECVFGEIVDGKMNLSPLGIIVDVLWHEIKNIHGIIMLLGDDNTNIEMRCGNGSNGDGGDGGDGGVRARHALPLRRRPMTTI